MKKKIVISIVAIIAVVASVIGAKYMSSGGQGVDLVKDVSNVVASSFREGISISPTVVDGSGMGVGTEFKVSFEKGREMTIEDLEKAFELEPTKEVTIKADEDGYIVTPESAFEKNSLVKVSINQMSWMFQCETDFTLLGSLPRNEGTNVPINSGIELYFSHKGAEVEEYFAIEPMVDGEFTSYGSTVVFVPETLSPKTVYTVTLEAGLSLEGSDKVMAEKTTFSFETGMDEEEVYVYPKGYFNYYSTLNDFGVGQPVYIPMNFSINEPSDKEVILTTKIYAYDEMESMVSDLVEYLEVPSWRSYYEGSQIKATESLEPLIEFEQVIEDLQAYETTIDVPVSLDEGAYLVQTTWEDISFQTFVQVTDLSYLYFEDEVNAYYWVNDLSTDQPAVGTLIKGSQTKAADANGFIKVEKDTMTGVNSSILSYKGKEVVNYTTTNQYAYNNYNHYWKYLQTDRNLYQPTDDLQLFGFLKNRVTGDYPETVTVSIEEQRWYYQWFWPSLDQETALVSQELTVEKGFYEGGFTLPNLQEGGYQVQVKSGDEVIGTHYIQVENYVKPDYKIAVESDKKAIFVNDTVTFTTRTSFFEGTPVADLMVGYDLYGMNYVSGTGVTNNEGGLEFAYTPTFVEGYQGETYGSYSTYASLPESGELYGQASVRVFVNDRHVAIEAEVDEGVGIIKASVHKINLDRLNDESAVDSQDYLDQGIGGQRLSGLIYRNEWVRELSGEYYDFINKVTRKTYRYRKDTTVLAEVELVTGNDGQVMKEVLLPVEEDVYYTLELKTMDGNNHEMAFEQYFGQTYEDYNIDESYLYMTSDKTSYRVDEQMSLEMLRGKVPAEGLTYLYILGTGGLKEVVWSKEASIELPFRGDYLPEVEVIGVIYNGEGYEMAQSMALSVVQEDYLIDLTLLTDQSSYQPGDEVTINVHATSKDGQAISDGRVNVSIVDEALLALSDQEINPLADLYGWVGSGLSHISTSHNNMDQGFNNPMIRAYGMEEMAKSDFSSDVVMTESLTMSAASNLDVSATVEVRSAFKDTAFFGTVILDHQGSGTINFTLPDNVTSWRLTAAAVSESLKAGSDIEALKVTLPFFVNTSMNQTYLVGDKPQIGVVAYGNDLVEGEEILYTVVCESENYRVSAEGSAFDRVRLPLFELEEGQYKIQVIAQSESGMADGYEEVITVVPTYQEKRVSDTYVAEAGLKLSSSEFGMTRLTFVDRSKGMYISDLYGLSYSGGKRVDQLYLAFLASEELNRSFAVVTGNAPVSLADYMTNSGGIALLPYSEADLETSVKLAGLIEDGSQKNRLKGYLYNAYYQMGASNKLMALYGLISMGEPMLNELNQLAMIETMTIEDQLWLAMSYGEVGDTYKANLIYEEFIETYMEDYEGKARLALSDDTEQQYKMTARVLPLLAEINVELARDAYAFVREQQSELYLANLDIYAYVLKMMSLSKSEEGAITYSYDGSRSSLKLGDGYGQSIHIPSAKLSTFKVEEVTSDVLVVAEYNAIGNREGSVDDHVEVQRHYENYRTGEVTNVFKEGDIVKVVLDWRIDEQAIDWGYTITDYVPSGLVAIQNYWQFGINDGYYWYRDIDGQKVSFGVYKNSGDYEPLVYFARVVSPGNFKSDQAMIQGFNVLDSYNLTQSSQVSIEAGK